MRASIVLTLHLFAEYGNYGAPPPTQGYGGNAGYGQAVGGGYGQPPPAYGGPPTAGYGGAPPVGFDAGAQYGQPPAPPAAAGYGAPPQPYGGGDRGGYGQGSGMILCISVRVFTIGT